MGHRITTQSRGKGGPTYRVPSHRYKIALRHIGKGETTIRGTVIDIEHDPARHSPIALVRLEDGSKIYMLVTEGIGIHDEIVWGPEAEVRNGNTLPSAPSQPGLTSATLRPARMMEESLSGPAEFRQSLWKSPTGLVFRCRAELRNGSTPGAERQSALLPEEGAERSPSSKQATNSTR